MIASPTDLPTPHPAGAPWTLADAAGFLNVSKRTIERLADGGQLRTIRVGLRRRLVPDAEVQRLAVHGCEGVS